MFLDRAEETAEQIRKEGGEAYALQADITRVEQCEGMAAAVVARHERIDVLVNNVGILAKGDGGIDTIELSAYERIVAVNVKGLLLTTKAVLPTMRAQGRGVIVNISSAAADWGGYHVGYEISKAAVNRLTTSTAQSQARHGIRCNAVKLGLMDTPMAITSIAQTSGRAEAEVRAQRDSAVPLGGKMGTGWDAAFATLFLASDESRFITGAILPVDGGTGVRAATA